MEDSGTGMAHAAAVEGADLVMVCGGDGTVREVCAELAGTGIPVGIIPAGTGNLLARNLDIPLYLRAAIDVALTGQDRAIDLVEVSGDHLEDTHFMVMAGMGMDAAMMEGVNEDIKKRVGWLAYVLSGFKALMFPPERIDISVDDGEFTRHRARTVVVGNVGFLQAGMPLLPDAAIDDGLLDVVVLHPRGFFSWIPLALRVLTRGRRTDETINRMTGRTVVLRAHGDVPRQLDGDTIGPGRELRDVVPGGAIAGAGASLTGAGFRPAYARRLGVAGVGRCGRDLPPTSRDLRARRIAYQGEPGANSHTVCLQHYPDWEAVPCASFEDVFALVENGDAELAMIPIDNSIAGRVSDIHHFLPDSRLHIVAEHFLRIRFMLMGAPGHRSRRSGPCTATCTRWASAAG